MKTKYVLKNTNTKKYFKGYPGKGNGKVLANKPTWCVHASRAFQFADIDLATHTRRRLFCQSQFVEVIPNDNPT